jgi:hypothetical protein
MCLNDMKLAISNCWNRRSLQDPNNGQPNRYMRVERQPDNHAMGVNDAGQGPRQPDTSNISRYSKQEAEGVSTAIPMVGPDDDYLQRDSKEGQNAFGSQEGQPNPSLSANSPNNSNSNNNNNTRIPSGSRLLAAHPQSNTGPSQKWLDQKQKERDKKLNKQIAKNMMEAPEINPGAPPPPDV